MGRWHFAKLIEQKKFRHSAAFPLWRAKSFRIQTSPRPNTSSLLTLGGGGAQLQPDLVGKIDDQVATARPSTGYGMTETCGIITSIGADYFVDKPASWPSHARLRNQGSRP